MSNYLETKYNWLKISILAGVLLSVLIFILAIWGIPNQPAPVPTLASPSFLIINTPTPIILIASPTLARDIFTPASVTPGKKKTSALPSPTPIITFPYSQSVCPTEAATFDKNGKPNGCLVRPLF